MDPKIDRCHTESHIGMDPNVDARSKCRSKLEMSDLDPRYNDLDPGYKDLLPGHKDLDLGYKDLGPGHKVLDPGS